MVIPARARKTRRCPCCRADRTRAHRDRTRSPDRDRRPSDAHGRYGFRLGWIGGSRIEAFQAVRSKSMLTYCKLLLFRAQVEPHRQLTNSSLPVCRWAPTQSLRGPSNFDRFVDFSKAATHIFTPKQLILDEVGKRNNCCNRLASSLDNNALPLPVCQSNDVRQIRLHIRNCHRQDILINWTFTELALPSLLRLLPILSIQPLNDSLDVFVSEFFARLCRFGKSKSHPVDLVSSLLCIHSVSSPFPNNY